MSGPSFTAPNIEAINSALDAATPSRKQLIDLAFSEVYEKILAAFAKGVNTKDVRGMLANSGLKLSAATFKKKMEKEAQKRETKARSEGDGA